MKKTTAINSITSPAGGTSPQSDTTAKTRSPKAQFLMAALNMSWQLAIVVLVPIIGGYELDKKLNTVPALTVVGFIVAMTGMGLVVWRQLQLFSPPPAQPPVPQSSKGRRS